MAKKKYPILSFDEIKDSVKFENLVAEYFKSLTKEDFNIIDVKVAASGIGSDGGRDLIVKLELNDGIFTFKRRWVVQCKFYKNSVNKSDLADINIPTLIHEYNANGYLLVCKNNVTSKVTEMFENLNNNCHLRYHYEIWNGETFKGKILANPSIHEQFFPKYFNATNVRKQKK